MNDPLRVLLLTAKLSPAAGGLAVSVPGLAHELDEFNDMEVHVMGTEDPADPGAAQLWGRRTQGFKTYGPAALQRAPKMARALRQLAPDIVDVQGLWTWSSRESFTYFRRHRKPYVVTPRGMLDPWARRNSAWKKRLFAIATENAHLRNAACLRATSELEAAHFREIGLRNPVAIIPNGIDLPVLAARQKQPLRSILFLSRIHPKKGASYLLTAWEALQQDFPDWQLIIAGIDENGHEKQLKRIAAEKQLVRVQFIGAVHGTEKQQLYRNADLFVLPTHAENFGLVVAEALAQETPVITTTNAPWSGLHTYDCGWWVELDQPRITETLRAALMQPREALEAMGQRGRTWVSREFGMEQVAARMRDVYLWAASDSKRPDLIHD